MVNGSVVKLKHRWLNNDIMSSEQKYFNTSTQYLNSDFNKKTLDKVDNNDLLAKVRVEEKKNKKNNLIFLGVISSIIALTGIIVY